MTAPSILRAAISHMEDRAKTYDKPEGERSMGATVDAFRAVSGVSMTEEQGWLFMALLKAVRTQQGAHKADNYEDGAAYFALAGEAAVRDRMPADFGQQNQLDTGALRFEKAVDWYVYAYGNYLRPDNYKQIALDAMKSSKGKLIIEEFGLIDSFKGGGFTGKGGPLTRCIGCTESNCMC
jgi:hypothetical protein